MSFLDVLSDDQEEQRRTRRVHGVVYGKVTDNHDPLRLGRVKISYPWLSPDVESDWAEVLSFMAGEQRGAFFLPEVEDVVLVAFEHGDFLRPVVLGGLWDKNAPPPEKNDDGKNNTRKLRSRSGHEIVFSDNSSDRKEALEIHSNGGHSVLLSDESGSEKIELRSAGGHVISLNDASGQEVVAIRDKTGSNAITMQTMSGSVTIESTTKLSIKSAIIEIEASGMLSIKAGGVATLQGALVKIN